MQPCIGGCRTHRNVGWDMLIEWLNRAIKGHVTSHISRAQIERFILNWPFMENVRTGIRDFVYELRAARDFRWRDVDGDVANLVQFFRDKIGKDWAHATRLNTTPHVLTTDGSRSRPWKEIQRTMGLRGDKAPY